MPPQDALTKAKAFQLDLVEISPKAKPPVCKIIDFGKFKYDIAKKERDAKKNNVASKLKELKFHLNIDGHDYGIKMKHAEQFMLKGMKVKILLRFRGREMQHQNLGMELVKRIITDLAHIGNADYEPKLVGRNINLMLSPLPLKKRVRKYTQENEQVEEIEDDQEEQDEQED